MSSSASSSAANNGLLEPLLYLPSHTEASSMINGPSDDYTTVDYANIRGVHQSVAEKMAGTPSEEEATEPDVQESEKHVWTSPDGSSFNVRGLNYLEDSKKIQHGDKYMCTLEAVQVFNTPNKSPSNVASNSNGFVAARRAAGDDRFYIIVNYQCGGDPAPQLIVYFAMRKDAFSEDVCGQHAANIQRCWENFLQGDDDYKNARWKVIPGVPEGHWTVRNTLGQKPALLARKLTHHWVHNKDLNYLEVDCDVSSSSMATRLMSLVKNNAKWIVVDLAFLIEGQAQDELPEHILGAVRMHHMYLAGTPVVDPERDYAIVCNSVAEYEEKNGGNGWFSGVAKAFGY